MKKAGLADSAEGCAFTRLVVPLYVCFINVWAQMYALIV